MCVCHVRPVGASYTRVSCYTLSDRIFLKRIGVLKGEVGRQMNFTYVLGFAELRDVVKVFPVNSSLFARKRTGRNRARSHSGA